MKIKRLPDSYYIIHIYHDEHTYDFTVHGTNITHIVRISNYGDQEDIQFAHLPVAVKQKLIDEFSSSSE